MTAYHEPRIEVLSSQVTQRNSNERDTNLEALMNPISEETPLLEKPSCYEYMKKKFKRLNFLKSKSAILILIWSFLAGVLHWAYTDPGSIITPVVMLTYFQQQPAFVILTIGSMYVYFAILQLFYPLAGFLADVRCGRYKCVVGSLWCFVGSSVLVGVGLVLAAVLPLYLYPYANDTHDNSTTHWLSNAAFYVIVAFLGPPVVIGTFSFFSSTVAFHSNVTQFGLDQLHDAPTEHLVLFIHWYVVLSYAGTELIRATANTLTSLCRAVTDIYVKGYVVYLAPLITLLTYICLVTSLCIASCKCRAWFFSNSSSRNPYGLVYRVIRFARAHKTPIQRSAFTYCEEELPSRLDLGKAKYGGPFTTEQVEDVKVFLGILKVLLTLGPLFAAERSNNFLLPIFFIHIRLSQKTSYSCSLLSNDILPSVVIVFLLILYIVLVRPFVVKYIPGILKRVGIGMVLMIIPTLCFFIIDTVYHKVSPINPGCFLRSTTSNATFIHPNYTFEANLSFLLIPLVTSITGSMIFSIAIYEFIYSQSPHSMKGLMFGAFFAIRGVFQLLGALIFIFPFLGWNMSTAFPSCGFVYFLVNMIAALVGIIVYIWVARRYQYRQRDEPDNVYRYVEEYYSKAQDKPDFDYDDYDNLNVHG